MSDMIEIVKACSTYGGHYLRACVLLAKFRGLLDTFDEATDELTESFGGTWGRIRRNTTEDGATVWAVTIRNSGEKPVTCVSGAYQGAIDALRAKLNKQLDAKEELLIKDYREWQTDTERIEASQSDSVSFVKYYTGANNDVVMFKFRLEYIKTAENKPCVTGFKGLLCWQLVRAEINCVTRIRKVLKDGLAIPWLDADQVVPELARRIRAHAVKFAGEGGLSQQFLDLLADKEAKHDSK